MTSKKSEEAYEQDWYNSLKAFAAKAAQSAEAEDDETEEETEAQPPSDEVSIASIDAAPEPDAVESEPFERPNYVVDDAGTMASLEAIDAIFQIGGPGAVAQLIACLVDDEAIVRTLCLDLLGRLEDPRAVDAVREMLEDPDPGVVSMARATLNRLKASA